MSTKHISVRIALVAVASLLVWQPEAHAYLDAATGSMVIQSALAALFGSLFFLKSTWARIMHKLRGTAPAVEQEAQDTETSEA